MRRIGGARFNGVTILDDADRYPESTDARDVGALRGRERAQGLVSRDIVVLALALLGASVALLLIAYVVYLFGSANAGDWRIASFVLTAILVLAAALALALALYAAWSAVRVTRIVKAPGLVPFDVSKSAGAAEQLGAYNERELVYAEQSAFRGLQGTYAPSSGATSGATSGALSRAQRMWAQLSTPSAPLFTVGYTMSGDEELRVQAQTFSHMLVAGESGSGKTTTLIHACRQLAGGGGEVWVVDLKSDLSVALAPVAHVLAETQPDVVSVIQQIDAERVRRQQLRVSAKARDYAEYVSKTGDTLPRIYLAIDEVAELVSVRKGKRDAVYARAVLDSLLRLARSEGIHVLTATQYVNANVLPRATTQQFSTRLYFGGYDMVAVRVLFSGRASKEECSLLSGEPGTGLAQMHGQAVRAFVATPP
jgi:S-DNA-T family DNA segregation ATPase FtsK/SpoIIIE